MAEFWFMQNKKNFKVADKIGMFRNESLKLHDRNTIE